MLVVRNGGVALVDVAYCYSPYVAGRTCPKSSQGTDTDKRQYSLDSITSR